MRTNLDAFVNRFAFENLENSYIYPQNVEAREAVGI